MLVKDVIFEQSAILRLDDISVRYTKSVDNVILTLYMSDDSNVYRIVSFDRSHNALEYGKFYEVSVAYNKEYQNYRLRTIKLSDTMPATKTSDEERLQLATSLDFLNLHIQEEVGDILLTIASRNINSFKLTQGFLTALSKAMKEELWKEGTQVQPFLLRSHLQVELKQLDFPIDIRKYVIFELLGIPLTTMSIYHITAKQLNMLLPQITKEVWE